MKVTTGFVAVQPDGQFLRFYSRYTHTGHHVDVAEVGIDDATVMPFPNAMDHRERQELEKRKVTWVPVMVRHECILEGYGPP